MPIYEYRCSACGYELDVLQKLSDDPLTDCPACETPSLQKKLSAPSFRLKGSGWYETDFKQDKRKNLHDGGEAGTDKAPAAKESTANKENSSTESTAKTTPAKNTQAAATAA